MTNQWIANEACKTALTLPLLILIATGIIAYVVSLFSYKKSQTVVKFGLICGVLAFALAWTIIFFNAVAMR